MCTLYNYFFVTGNVMRGLILVLAIPAAIFGNAGRIVASGIAGQYNRAYVQGATHEAFGYVSVVLAAIACVVLHLGMSYIRKVWQTHRPGNI